MSLEGSPTAWLEPISFGDMYINPKRKQYEVKKGKMLVKFSEVVHKYKKYIESISLRLANKSRTLKGRFVGVQMCDLDETASEEEKSVIRICNEEGNYERVQYYETDFAGCSFIYAEVGRLTNPDKDDTLQIPIWFMDTSHNLSSIDSEWWLLVQVALDRSSWPPSMKGDGTSRFIEDLPIMVFSILNTPTRVRSAYRTSKFKRELPLPIFREGQVAKYSYKNRPKRQDLRCRTSSPERKREMEREQKAKLKNRESRISEESRRAFLSEDTSEESSDEMKWKTGLCHALECVIDMVVKNE